MAYNKFDPSPSDLRFIETARAVRERLYCLMETKNLDIAFFGVVTYNFPLTRASRNSVFENEQAARARDHASLYTINRWANEKGPSTLDRPAD